MTRSPVRILTVALLCSAVGFTGCSKKKSAAAEVRLPSSATSVDTSAAPPAEDATSEIPLAASGGPGAPWQPGGSPNLVPPDQGIGSTRINGGFSVDDGTGGIAQNANLDGVESAVQMADLDMIHFGFDKHLLTPEWRSILEEHASWLKQNPEVHVQIEGHTDERGTEEYNVSLGQKRADAVREFLVEKGIQGYRLSTISYGKLRPLTFEESEEAHSLNRRAMFLVYSPGTETASVD